MNLLIEDVHEFAEFLIEYDITADQFFCCVLLSSEAEGYKGLPDRQSAISKFYKYHNMVVKGKKHSIWKKEHMDELVEKGFLQRVRPKEDLDRPYKYDNFEATEKFLDLVFEEQGSAMGKYEEFWSEYPARYETQDGKNLNIKSVNKEMLFNEYKSALNEEDHETIMKCLKLAKQKDEVNCRIDKWLQSHQWEVYLDEIEDFQEDQSQSTHTVL